MRNFRREPKPLVGQAIGRIRDEARTPVDVHGETALPTIRNWLSKTLADLR